MDVFSAERHKAHVSHGKQFRSVLVPHDTVTSERCPDSVPLSFLCVRERVLWLFKVFVRCFGVSAFGPDPTS